MLQDNANLVDASALIGAQTEESISAFNNPRLDRCSLYRVFEASTAEGVADRRPVLRSRGM